VVYRLTGPVTATSIDDAGHARMEGDTQLPPGTEVRIVEGKHSWPPRPETDLYYTVEATGARYNVAAAELDAVLGRAVA
jgi:hypothetical protein